MGEMIRLDIDGEHYAILRQIDGGCGWADGIHWQGELWDADDLCGLNRPLSLAWYTGFRGSACPEMGVAVNYAITPDDLRRRGYARKLLAAIDAHYGGRLYLGEAISEEGEALIASLMGQDTREDL